MNFFIDNLYTVVLFPLWIFAIIVLGRLFNVILSRRAIALITLISTLYGVVFSVGCFLFLLKTPEFPNFAYETSFPFIKIADYAVNFGVYIDNLSILMLILVTTISFVVQLYSSNYMFKDSSFPRFFGYLNLFNFSMIGLVLSPNLFQNYVFWELVGVSSYLLIGFWYKKPSAADAAKKAFLINRIGDFGLLTGTIIVSYFMYQYSGFVSLATVPFASLNDVGNYLYSYTTDIIFILICILLLFGSFAKSAQFPLHTWLADAMEGPTPVSALIHSATMVAAGVYLIARLYPIFSLNNYVMSFIAVIGLFTALICAFFAITQNDLKRILAYSTNSQLGLMFLALGLGVYTGGIYHLVTHAYFKSMLFLCSGIAIHSVLGQQDIRFMGGLRKFVPFTAICYFIGCLSISGLLFSGFYSKEMMLSGIIEGKNIIYSVGFLIVALMTAFYMFRSYFLVFEGEYRGSHHPHNSNFILNLCIGTLALATITIGYYTHSNFTKFIQAGQSFVHSVAHFNPVYLSIGVASTGFVLAFILYNTKIKPISLPVLYKLSFNRFYIDNFYDFIAKRIYYIISRFCSLFDKYVIDGLVKFTTLVVRSTSWVFSRMQTGNFQSYLVYSAVFLAVVFAGLMFAYTLIVKFSLISGGPS